MTSSSNSLPLAWLEGDLKLPHIPFPPRKPDRRNKSSKQISKLLYDAPKFARKKLLTEEPPAKDDFRIKEVSPQQPHDLSGIMNPALIFGLQVSTLISRDKMILQRQSAPLPEDDSPDSTIIQRKRALDHAKLVIEQLNQRSEICRRVKIPRKISVNNLETFKFTELPPEIRDMIYTFYFTNSSGEKPSLMWAFKMKKRKIKGGFYDAAEKIYYTVNNWTFSAKECVRNSILGNMDDFHIGMIRKMTIEIPSEVQACTKFSSQLSRAVNVDDLTLATRSDTGVKRLLHEILPGFKNLRRITLTIQRQKKAPVRRLLNYDSNAIEYYNLFRQAREMLNRVIGQKGVLIQETDQMQWWRWEVDSPEKVFEITCPKKHIKFE